MYLTAVQTDDVTDELADSANSFVDSTIDALPRLGVALFLGLLGYGIAKLVRYLLYRSLSTSQTESFARVMSKIASWVVLGLVIGVAVTITFPSVKPVDLLAGLGFFSVAVGFAFQDILENTLSGVLLLLRQPFQSGDQIVVDGNEGTVEAITIRETRMRQYDGQLLVVPNRDVYKNAIRVQTDREHRRIAFTVGVAYEADLETVQSVVLDALRSVDNVRTTPEPEVLVVELAASTINLDVRCWVDSSQHDARLALDAVIRATKRVLDEEGIEMPSDIMALQATSSFRAALHDRPVTDGGSVAKDESTS